LYGADLRGEKLTKNPVFINGLLWPVTITTHHIQIGCQVHAVGKWREFSDDEVSEMSDQALVFWNVYKSIILALADALQ
jgi:hypothetical protein